VQKEHTDVLCSSSPNELVYNIPELHHKPLFIQEYLLFRSLKEFVDADIDWKTVHVLLRLTRLETGSSLSLANNTTAFRDRERLVIRLGAATESFQHHIRIGQSYTFRNFSFHSSLVNEAQFSNDHTTEFADAEKLSNDLVLRSWQKGDWFIPLGMNEKKKLSDFFIEQKVPLFEKHSIPLLESDGNIVWVCGYRLDNRYKITEQTTKIAKFVYQPHQQKT
jgi:tRNA(Ile)-lysidine synthase